MKKQSSLFSNPYSLLILLALFLFPVFASANSWTKQTGSGAKTWWAVSGSVDGTKIVAVPDYGYIYTSVNSGVDWTERQGAGQQAWMDVESSSDGTKMVAIIDESQIYYSTNSGATWSLSSVDSHDWGAITSSADGSIVYAISGVWYGGVIYKSTDSGATFAPLDSGTYEWKDITTSDDGQIVSAVVTDGAIYYSGDSGATWNLSDSGNRQWRSITSSASGQYMASAVTLGGAVYTSSDYGATWTVSNSGNRDWKAITSSADGNKLVAVEFNGLVYSSPDRGANWSVEVGAGTGDWRDIFSSSDGEILVALNYTDPEPGAGGYIFTYGPAVISVTSPVVVTVSATPSTSTAQLVGNITSDGNASSTDRGFHYGLTTSYGSTSSSTGTFGIGSYSKNISGLTCGGTLYHYRAFAINSAGMGTSSDATFTTSACDIVVTTPVISTPSSGSITATGVTLTATVSSDGNASSTDYGFEYGLTTAYGLIASTTASFGIGNFSKAITGLTCETTYNYRAFTTNSAGTASTTNASFTTSACPSTPPAQNSSSGGGGTTLLTRAISVLNKSGIHSNGLNITLPESNNQIDNFLDNYIFSDVQNKQIRTLWKELHAHGYEISITTFKETLSRLSINPINSSPINPLETSTGQNAGEEISAVFATGLYKGLQSNDVSRLQKLLARDQAIYPEGIVTGFFGNLTEQAVQRFQIEYGVVLSAEDTGYGYVGPKTRAKLLEIFGR